MIIKTIHINSEPVFGEKSMIEKIEKLLLDSGAKKELDHPMKTIYIDDQPVYGDKSTIEQIEKLLLEAGAKRELEHHMNPLIDESVYMQNIEEKTNQPQILGWPDEHWLYVVFPGLNQSELLNFARSVPDGARLVKKYFGIKINPFVLDELIFFPENSLRTNTLNNIFNIISPNSSKFITIKGKPILALNKTLISMYILDSRETGTSIDGILKYGRIRNINLHLIMGTTKTGTPVYVYVKKNTNEELENKLLQLAGELDGNIYFVNTNNKVDQNVHFNTVQNMNEGDFMRAKSQNQGILFSFNFPNLVFYKGWNIFELLPPIKKEKEEEEEEKEDEDDVEEEENEEDDECKPNYDELLYRIHNSPLNEYSIKRLLDKKKDSLDFKQKLIEIIGYLKSENYPKFYDRIWKKGIFNTLHSRDYHGNKIFTCKRVNSFLDRLRRAEIERANEGEWEEVDVNVL